MFSGDEILKKHLMESKIQYTSPKIQNKLIDICGQFSLCVRYVEEVDKTAILREGFLIFVSAKDLTGKQYLYKKFAIKHFLELSSFGA
jgi:hypothetical protein